jgi:hypothetical protein
MWNILIFHVVPLQKHLIHAMKTDYQSSNQIYTFISINLRKIPP